MKINKRASGGGGAPIPLLVGVLVVVLIADLVNIANRECNRDSQCGKNQYCTSNYECKDIPLANANIYEVNLIGPAIIIAIGLIIAAAILKFKKSYLSYVYRDQPHHDDGHGGHH